MTLDPLDKFRRAAKALKASYEAGVPDGLTRLKLINPRSGGDAFKHADFLHVIAREHNFASWPAMKESIQSHGLDRAQDLQRLKIALHAGQTGVVTNLLENTPNLAEGHFGLLCALYDVRAVWAMLSADPTLAVTLAGPVLPIVHLCRSRMFNVWPDKVKDAVAIADMLVANGADLNVGSVEGDAPLSPLYWALGHAGNLELAAWLLDKGADPNDGESLYHATELGHMGGVQLLLDHKADPKLTNALPRAMDFDNADMVEALLRAGADPNEGSDAWAVGTGMQRGVPVLHQAARRMNTGPVLDLLLEYGADASATWNGLSGYAFAKVFGNFALVERLEARGQTAPLNTEETLLAAAAEGQIQSTFIDPAKLPDAYRNILREILHLPGKLPHLRALVALGLEWDLADRQGVTPVQAAGWSGLPDVLDYFLSLGPDLGHVNSYGGTLLSTILHGADNNPQRKNGDYLECLRLVLEHGVALPRKALNIGGDVQITAFLSEWARAHPGQVVEHGIV